MLHCFKNYSIEQIIILSNDLSEKEINIQFSGLQSACHASESWHPARLRLGLDASFRWHDNGYLMTL
jgi:hypothetical protein